ncbi:hypothetical protein R1sor_014931 [Riccia sorocarpa]|uniref:Odorant receptor n=1 Tax=Riccia sorocarpa TaxID=122646 RepID=A0ABD3HAS7_9MARC
MSIGVVDSVAPAARSEATVGSLPAHEENGGISNGISSLRRNDCAFHEEERKGGGFEDVLLPHMAELEARATVKFDKLTFLKEELYHNFFPLSIPFMYFLDGKKWALINRGFIGRDHFGLACLQWFLAANFYLLNVVSFAYIPRAKKLDFLYDVVLIDFLWFMRNMVVSTKYAFLSKIEREQMKTMFVPNDVHVFRTLLNAWKDPIPNCVVKHELLFAAVRTKQLFLRSYCFKLDSSYESSRSISDLVHDLRLLKESKRRPQEACWDKLADRWLQEAAEELTAETMLQAEEGSVGSVQHLPVRLYAAHVIRQASSLRRLKRIGHGLLSQHLTACSILLGVAHPVILIVGRYVIGGHEMPGPTWTVYCIIIPGFFLSAFSMFSNVGFMMVGVLDFRRRHFIAQSLDELLRSSVYKGSHNVRAMPTRSMRIRDFFSSDRSPRNDPESTRSSRSSSFSSGKLSGDGIGIDFQAPDSLLAWWACRQLMQNFGLGFYKRIKYYTTYFASYCGVLLFFVVLKMLTGIKRTDIYLIVTVIFSITVFLSLLALMVWPGGDTNTMLQQHGVTLMTRKIKLHTKTVMGCTIMVAKEDLKKTRMLVRTITSIAEALKWDNFKSKLSVCGFEARDQLVSVIVAVVAASMSIGVGQIVQNGITM